MNTTLSVFLTAILATGITVATDQKAKQVAMEKLNDPDFLVKQDPLVHQVSKNVLGVPGRSEWSAITDPRNPYGVFTVNQEKEWENTAKEMLQKTEDMMKDTIEYIAQAGTKAVKEAKNELPGALEKAKAIGTSIAKTLMKYINGMMSFIAKSFNKMMGKDESKGQKIYTNDDELKTAGKRDYESDRAQDRLASQGSDSTNTPINQDGLADPSPMKNNALSVLNMEGR